MWFNPTHATIWSDIGLIYNVSASKFMQPNGKLAAYEVFLFVQLLVKSSQVKSIQVFQWELNDRSERSRNTMKFQILI